MKRLYVFVLAAMLCLHGAAQDEKPFKGYLYNEEYKVYVCLDFYDNDVVSPLQEIFGKLPGYFGHDLDSRQWLFTSAKIVSPSKARLEIVNDYGSEDLTATLTVNKNGEYTLKQEEGSRIKIAVNRKWVKIPTELKLKKQPRPSDL